jgi:hypothetical protein
MKWHSAKPHIKRQLLDCKSKMIMEHEILRRKNEKPLLKEIVKQTTVEKLRLPAL